jgi:uncharacterized membrane protein
VSGPAVVACLVFTVVLVLGAVVLLGRSLRRDDASLDLLALVALLVAVVPAAAYGVASA